MHVRHPRVQMDTLTHGKHITQSLNIRHRSNWLIPSASLWLRIGPQFNVPYLGFGPLDRYPSNFQPIVIDLLAWLITTF
ncbi:hypothetical protein SPFCAV_04568 [Salmonella enterica subsp. enterica serovar Gallinarum/Pullorum str. FCAV198]|nr:hypothetical protein SPFCAV_04568 [Salmonella enterica subsp. enterica serovar Gallinarum/Pullorum str. FCAV198]